MQSIFLHYLEITSENDPLPNADPIFNKYKFPTKLKAFHVTYPPLHPSPPLTPKTHYNPSIIMTMDIQNSLCGTKINDNQKSTSALNSAAAASDFASLLIIIPVYHLSRQ